MSRVLVVEDESHIGQGLRFNLEAEGHAVTLVETGEDALRLTLEEQQSFDVIVLDVMLPGKDGFAVAHELRTASNYTPLLTALGRPEEVLKGFESGADDYLPKPFNLNILIARIASLLRRKGWAGDDKRTPSAAPAPDIYEFDGRVVDFQKLTLRNGDQVFQLTLMECELLRYFIRHAGHPVSRKAILEDVWSLHEDTDTRAIDNFIVRLRRYIEPNPSKPSYLITVRGVGYEFRTQAESMRS
jgi:DNA-binding response OmpR family regulator